MNKFVVIGTVLTCFVFYSLLPLAGSIVLLTFSSEDHFFSVFNLVIWTPAVLVQLFAMKQIFKKNAKGLHLFFSVIFLYVFLQAGDEVIIFLDSVGDSFPFSSILNMAVYPLLAAWVLYCSDAKDFFDTATES